MKKSKSISNQIKLIGVQGRNRYIDFYIVLPGNRREYAFTRRFSIGVYKMFKGGIRINDIISLRSRDKAVMKVVNQTNRMLPYFVEYFDLPPKAA